MNPELEKVLDEMGTAFEAFKKVNDLRMEQIEKTGKAAADLVEKQQRIEARLDELSDAKDRICKLEADRKLPARDGDSKTPQEDIEHVKAWDNWLRNPRHPESIRGLEEAGRAAAKVDRPQYDEKGNRTKAVTITTTGGGNMIPTLVAARMQAKIKELSPIRQIANVAAATNENLRFVVRDNNSTSGWAAGGGARSETVTPLFHAVTLTYGTAYSYPQVQEEAMNDIAMDVPMLVEQWASEDLAYAEGVAFISGDGSARPTGFLNGSAVSPQTIVATADEASPERAFRSLQYLPTGAAASFLSPTIPGVLQSPIVDPAAVFMNVVYALKAAYRNNARWVSNKATLGVVRKLRDGDGRYIWAPGLVAGQPNMLAGYPITEAEAMPNLGANAFPMAFGDFSSAYQIADIIPTLRITVDDNITAPGFVKFYVRRRVGGNLANDDALKVIKCATS